MEENTEARKPHIVCSAGPFLVTALTNLFNSRGERLETKPVTALCRCGGSSHKPYCDGTHARIGFDGQCAGRQQGHVDSYVGLKINIYDDRSVCAHSGICTSSLPAVFDVKREPWIDPNGSDMHSIIDTIQRCPSGALSYSIEEVEIGQPEEHAPAITASKDGPYYVVGNISLADEQGSSPHIKEHYALCRCGASNNKPFCDGSHHRIGFKAETD